MYEAHLQYGYILKNIAEYIGLHYTTVSRVIKKIEREDEKWYCKPLICCLKKEGFFKTFVVLVLRCRKIEKD